MSDLNNKSKSDVKKDCIDIYSIFISIILLSTVCLFLTNMV